MPGLKTPALEYALVLNVDLPSISRAWSACKDGVCGLGVGTTTAGGTEQSGGLAILMLLTSTEPSMHKVVWMGEELGAPKGARVGRRESVPIVEEYDEMTWGYGN